MRFSGAAITHEYDGLAGLEVGAGGQGGQLSGLNGGHDVNVEFRKSFHPKEFGFSDAAGAAPLGAVVDFGGQQLGQKHQIGLTLPDRDHGQPTSFGADRGQPQLAGSRTDGGLGGLIASRAQL